MLFISFPLVSVEHPLFGKPPGSTGNVKKNKQTNAHRTVDSSSSYTVKMVRSTPRNKLMTS